MKSANEVIAFAKSKIGLPYVFGDNGHVLTQALLNTLATRYPAMYTASYKQRTWDKGQGREGYDCSGLIDVALGVDYNAHGYYTNCTEKGRIVSFSDMPDIKGLLLFRMDSTGRVYHIGIYIGNGQVIEARGVDYGVIQRERTSSWTHWGKCHLIDYGTESTSMLLKVGSVGSDVKELQAKLIRLGYAIIADGEFGVKTETAVKDFQTKQGLVADGIVGDKTQIAITVALNPVVVVPPAVDYVSIIAEKESVIATLTKQVEDFGKTIAGLTAINDTYHGKLVEVAIAFDTFSRVADEF